jgi:hypothetical protein
MTRTQRRTTKPKIRSKLFAWLDAPCRMRCCHHKLSPSAEKSDLNKLDLALERASELAELRQHAFASFAPRCVPICMKTLEIVIT